MNLANNLSLLVWLKLVVERKEEHLLPAPLL